MRRMAETADMRHGIGAGRGGLLARGMSAVERLPIAAVAVTLLLVGASAVHG
jgi:hypothetical protein